MFTFYIFVFHEMLWSYTIHDDVLWRFLRCLYSIHVILYDVFSDIHVIYMRCSLIYLAKFYGAFNNIH